MPHNSKVYIQGQLRQIKIKGDEMLEAIDRGDRNEALNLTRDIDTIIVRIRQDVANNMTQKPK
ncbi:MAG: hypothetical protein PHQ95_03965 [Candidatus Gracilibacteria bacterium]|nr:hypothetical protein [Candidatus Gracilibacteria bacterium]